jgi:O-antigen/teichoic acid export membrane protein
LLLPSYLWTLLVALLGFPVLWIFKLVDPQFMLHVCILSALSSFTAIHTSLLIGKEKIAASNLAGLVQPILIILFLAFFFFVKEWDDIYVYILALYFSFGASLIISFIYVIRLAGPFSSISFKDSLGISGEMLRYGILNQVAHITQMLSFRMSFYVLNSYHGESAVGIYSNGISLAESVWLIAKSISLVQYARISNSGDRIYSQKLTMQLVRASVLLSILTLVPLLLLPSDFYLYIFGKGFGGVKEVIWSLSGGVVIYNISILLGHYFSGTGRYQVNAVASSLGLVISVILFFTLIPAYGITGAGYATSVSYLFTTIILLVYFRKDNPGKFSEFFRWKGDFELLKKEFRGLFRS